MTRPKVTTAIIALNEEEDIEDCLRSVTWTDEIIVVDSGSSDRTVEIASRYTDKVFFNAWQGFAPQKNFAFSNTTGEWVLSIDADERVTGELRDEILKVISRSDALDGYYLPRRNLWLGKWIRHGGWYPDYTLRLFRRDRGECKYRVHERIVVEGRTGYLTADLIHHNLKSIDDHMRTLLRATTLEAEDALRNGVRFYWTIPVRPLVVLAQRFWRGPRDALALRLKAKEVLKNKVEVAWLIPLKPFIKFFTMYLFKQGFRDGAYGFFVAVLSSIYVILKYAKLWEMSRNRGSGGEWS